MHSVFTRPWHWRTILIVIVLVLVVPIGLFLWAYKGELIVAWAWILGLIAAALYLGAEEIIKLWKPARWFTGIALLAVTAALSLVLEPQGRFTFNLAVDVFCVLAVSMYAMELYTVWHEARRRQGSD